MLRLLTRDRDVAVKGPKILYSRGLPRTKWHFRRVLLDVEIVRDFWDLRTLINMLTARGYSQVTIMRPESLWRSFTKMAQIDPSQVMWTERAWLEPGDVGIAVDRDHEWRRVVLVVKIANAI